MFEIIGNAIGTITDLLAGRGNRLDPTDPCNAGDCPVARKELAAARASVKHSCWWLSLLLVSLQAALWVLTQPIVAYVVVAIILFVIFNILGVLIFFGAIFLAIVTVWTIVQVLPGVGQALSIGMQREGAAISVVMADCPQQCQGDLSPTSCDAVDANLPTTQFDGLLGLGDIRNLLDSLSS